MVQCRPSNAKLFKSFETLSSTTDKNIASLSFMYYHWYLYVVLFIDFKAAFNFNACIRDTCNYILIQVIDDKQGAVLFTISPPTSYLKYINEGNKKEWWMAMTESPFVIDDTSTIDAWLQVPQTQAMKLKASN